MIRRFLFSTLVAGSAFAGGILADGFVRSDSPLYAQLSAQGGSPLASPLPAPPPSALPVRAEPTEPTDGLSPLANRFEQVVDQVGPAVVAIDAVKPPPAAAPGATTRAKPTEESGSGAMVRLSGRSGTYVITNNHVIAGAVAADIMVTLADGRIFRPEQVWSDPESDIAVLRLAADDLPVVDLGDSDRVRVGQWVLAVGSPFGLNQTVTHGIISARDRGQISLGNTIRIKEFLQTDAAINPGSSGGPLVNLDGEIVGINTAIASNNGNNSGVSFSVPINLAKRVIRQLLEKGAVSRGYLGIQLAPTIQPAAALRLGRDRVWGALIETVHPTGPAATGGLRAGDVIVRLDGIDIRDENHLINLVSSLPAGQPIKLTVWRDRQWAAADVMVAAWSTASRPQ